MRSKLIPVLIVFCGLFSACKKQAPGQVPVPKAETAPVGADVSTAAATGQNPLAGPGNYLRTTVGQVQKAKDAKALYEEAAKENLQGLDLDDTGGN